MYPVTTTEEDACNAVFVLLGYIHMSFCNIIYISTTIKGQDQSLQLRCYSITAFTVSKESTNRAILKYMLQLVILAWHLMCISSSFAIHLTPVFVLFQ